MPVVGVVRACAQEKKSAPSLCTVTSGVTQLAGSTTGMRLEGMSKPFLISRAMCFSSCDMQSSKAAPAMAVTGTHTGSMSATSASSHQAKSTLAWKFTGSKLRSQAVPFWVKATCTSSCRSMSGPPKSVFSR